MRVPKPLLLGHRGARRYKPENTLAAFDLALRHGCDGFEFDVRVTSDGHALICHDPAYADFPIASTPYTNRVMHELVEFESVIALYRSAFLDIELKVREAVPHVVAAVTKYGLKDSFVASSFLPEALRDLHAASSSMSLGLIADNAEALAEWKNLPVAYVLPEQDLLTPELLSEAQAAGKKVIPWTVNDPIRMQAFLEMGVDGLISDDTLLLRHTADAVTQ
jgi:glycerophosphoryl diester phosphodiesterase